MAKPRWTLALSRAHLPFLRAFARAALAFLFQSACVYLPQDSSQVSSGTGSFDQCAATVAAIECSFPFQPHITIDGDSCAIVCEAPACPVGNLQCLSPTCAICLPVEIEFPLEECQAFVQSCDPSPSGPGSTDTWGSTGSQSDTTASPEATAAAETTGATGPVTSTVDVTGSTQTSEATGS